MSVSNDFQMPSDNILIQETFNSYAKINIGLNIYDKADNNYHILESLIQEISLKDIIKITIYRTSGDIEIQCHGIEIECEKIDNTCYAIANHIRNQYDIKHKILIELNKKIPIGGGLGGGSGNAAATLEFLNDQLGLNMNIEHKIDICKNIGMDVPFFINGGLQYAENMGEQNTPMPHLFNSYYFLLIFPQFNISTKWAYGKINKNLPSKKKNYNLLALEEPLNWALFRNDFEEIVIPRYPEIRELKEAMLDSGAVYSSLSGSGSTVFGIYKTYDQAIALAKKLNHKKYQSTVTTPIYR